MSAWTQKVKAHFLQKRQNTTTETTETPCIFTQECPSSTTETTETPLSMVLTVHSQRFCEKRDFEDSAGLAACEAPTGTIRPPGLSPKLLTASLALDGFIATQEPCSDAGGTHHPPGNDSAPQAAPDPFDDRVTCHACKHFRTERLDADGSTAMQCKSGHAAGLSASRFLVTWLAPDYARLPKRCRAHQPSTHT